MLTYELSAAWVTTLNKNEILFKISSPPSQEWLSSVLDWICDPAREKKVDDYADREILDALLHSRGARNRLDGVRRYVHNNLDSMRSFTSLIGLEKFDTIRQWVDAYISAKDENIVNWLIASDRSGKGLLLKKSDYYAGLSWLRKNRRHRLAPNLIGALTVYLPQDHEVNALGNEWCSDIIRGKRDSNNRNLSTAAPDEISLVIERMLESPLAYRSTHVAEEFVLSYLPSPEANRVLFKLVRTGALKGDRKQRLLAKWRELDASERDCRVLVELLKQTPQRRGLLSEAVRYIEDGCFSWSSLAIFFLESDGHKQLKKVVHSTVLDRLSSTDFEGSDNEDLLHSFDYGTFDECVELALTRARRGDRQYLKLVPNSYWLGRWGSRVGDRHPLVAVPEVLDRLREFVNEFPCSVRSFDHQVKLSKCGDDSATTWFLDWAEEAVIPEQIIRATNVILTLDPDNKRALEIGNQCIRQQLELGWGKSEMAIMQRLHASQLSKHRAKT